MGGRNSIIPGRYGGESVALHIVDIASIDLNAPHDRVARDALLKVALSLGSGVLLCALCGRRIGDIGGVRELIYFTPPSRRPAILAVAACPDCAGREDEAVAAQVLHAVGGDAILG